MRFGQDVLVLVLFAWQIGQIESGIAKAEVWASGALSLGLHLAYVSWGWQSRFGSNLICL